MWPIAACLISSLGNRAATHRLQGGPWLGLGLLVAVAVEVAVRLLVVVPVMVGLDVGLHEADAVTVWLAVRLGVGEAVPVARCRPLCHATRKC